MGSLCNLSSSKRNPHIFPSSSIIGKSESLDEFSPKHSLKFDSIVTSSCGLQVSSTSTHFKTGLKTCSSESFVRKLPDEPSMAVNSTASSPNVSAKSFSNNPPTNPKSKRVAFSLPEEAWDIESAAAVTGCICGCTCTQCVFRRQYIWNKDLLPEQMLSNDEYWDAQWFASREDAERDRLELEAERLHPTCLCTCFRSTHSVVSASSADTDRWVDINPYTKRPFENPHGKPRRYYPYTVRYHVEQFVSKRVWWPEDPVERYRWYFCWSAPDPSYLREPWDERAIRRFLKPLPRAPPSPKERDYDEFNTAPFEVLFPGLDRLSPSYIPRHPRLPGASLSASGPRHTSHPKTQAIRKRQHPLPSQSDSDSPSESPSDSLSSSSPRAFGSSSSSGASPSHSSN